MPKIAKNITIDKRTGRIMVDGEEFPWFVRDDASVYGLSRDDMLSVSISILTDDVTIIPTKWVDVPTESVS
jgi:hypothetical protein